MMAEIAATGGFLALGVLLGVAVVAGFITLIAARARRRDRADSSLASLATLFESPDTDDPFAGFAPPNGELAQTQPHPAPVPAASSRAAVELEDAVYEHEAKVDVWDEPQAEVAGAGAGIAAAAPAESSSRFTTISDRDWVDHAANAAMEQDIEGGAFRRALLAPSRLVMYVSAAVADRLWRLRRPSAGAPQPADWDYESLERDFGLHERIGPALVVGLVALAAVIVVGVWLVAAHHGTQPPIPGPRVPNPGPLGPQGSLPP